MREVRRTKYYGNKNSNVIMAPELWLGENLLGFALMEDRNEIRTLISLTVGCSTFGDLNILKSS